MNDNNLLTVQNLSVSFSVSEQTISILDEVSFSLKQGETFALVGESGCGKTVTAASLMRLLPIPQGNITSGTVIFDNKNILSLSESELEKIRGKEIAMIFQDPLQALDPVLSVRNQIEEVYKIHKKDLSKKEYKNAVVAILKAVNFDWPLKIMKAYPHQLSGGMLQRVMIAIALAAEPKLVIADEPTTSLDSTAQYQIVSLLKKNQEKNNTGMLFITHDMHLVKSIARSIAVMYAGQIVEYGNAQEIFAHPLHPYTQAMLKLSFLKYNTIKTRLPVISRTVQIENSNIDNSCRFYARCFAAQKKCKLEKPLLIEKAENHYVRCFSNGAIL